MKKSCDGFHSGRSSWNTFLGNIEREALHTVLSMMTEALHSKSGNTTDIATPAVRRRPCQGGSVLSIYTGRSITPHCRELLNTLNACVALLENPEGDA